LTTHKTLVQQRVTQIVYIVVISILFPPHPLEWAVLARKGHRKWSDWLVPANRFSLWHERYSFMYMDRL